MSSRSLRVLVSVAVPGVLALVVALGGVVSPPRAIARGDGGALLTHCFKAVLGLGRAPATPVMGSADAQVLSHLAVFRRLRSTADTLPAAERLREALAGAGATSYDPSAAVLLRRVGKHAAVYAVPATMSPATLPAGCSGLPQLAGAGAWLAVQAEATGSGPGACLILTQLEQSTPQGLGLPGMARPKPTKTLAVARTVCHSEAVLSSYDGALGDELPSPGIRLALIPDGVSAITYALADGRAFIVPVAGNLATPPAELSLETPLQHATAAVLRKRLAAVLPTTVTESGMAGGSSVTLARPVSLIPNIVGSLLFLRRVLGSGGSSESSSSSTGASCSARTHRCVAVTVTTTCDSHEHCRTSRTINRYRYVGAKPPPGTTGPNTQPTGPIVARVNRLIAGPRKLTLVLSGAPHRSVVVLLSVSCFSRNSAAGSIEPPLQLAVPSRTRIELPGPARTFHACAVGALVISSQRGRVHVTVARS